MAPINTIPYKPAKRKHRHPRGRPRRTYDWPLIYRLLDEGLSESAVGRQLGIPQRSLNNALKRHERQSAPTVNDGPLDITITDIMVEDVHLDPAIASDQSNGAPASHYIVPHHSTPQCDDHESRIAVLEAFMATLQRQPAYLPSTPAIALDRTEREWQKTGVELAADMRDALRDYAKALGLQVREVLDQALRRYLNGHSRHVPVDRDAEGGER